MIDEEAKRSKRESFACSHSKRACKFKTRNLAVVHISMSVLRFLAILLLGYAGFLRVNDLQSLRVQGVAVFTEHMSITIREQKNDQGSHDLAG